MGTCTTQAFHKSTSRLMCEKTFDGWFTARELQLARPLSCPCLGRPGQCNGDQALVRSHRSGLRRFPASGKERE